MDFRRGEPLDENPGSQFLLRRRLGDHHVAAVDVLHWLGGGVRNGRHAEDVRLATLFLRSRSNITSIKGDARGGTLGEDALARRKLRVRESFGEEVGAALVVHALEEGHVASSS